MSTISAGTTTGTALVSTGDTTGNLVLQVNGTTAALTLNTAQALGVGSGASFGTSGQVLTSAGSAAAPTWSTVSSDPGVQRVVVATGNGYGSTNVAIRRFQTVVTNTGASITYADSASLGATFTINNTGVYSITYADQSSGASTFYGVSLNGTALSTSIENISLTERLVMAGSNSGSIIIPISITLRLTAGDVIRAQAQSSNTQDNNSRVQFSINRVS